MKITEPHRIEGILNQAEGQYIMVSVVFPRRYQHTTLGKYHGILHDGELVGQVHNPLSGETMIFYINAVNSITNVDQPNGKKMIEVKIIEK